MPEPASEPARDPGSTPGSAPAPAATTGLLRVAALRRYPVKAMGGEELAVARFDARGIVGDRWWAVVDDDGRFASAKDTRRFRRRDAVLGWRAGAGADGGVVASRGGRSWTVGDPGLDAALTHDVGQPVRVLPEAGVPHQDAGAVSLVGTATLAWCAERWGGSPDARRLRANVVVATDEPFVEESWAGRTVRAGTVALAVVERAPRCRTVDVVQDGLDPGEPWLRGLGRERGLCVAVYADVETPGELRVGDAVTPG